jgi:putative pyruvate formate lyase activating enzyme
MGRSITAAGHHEPAYLRMPRRELSSRAEAAVAALSDCTFCPRECHADRTRGAGTRCRSGREAVVTAAFAHGGEEDPLRGSRGSGTIFFGWCSLGCVFCQNHDVSSAPRERPAGARSIAAAMLELQSSACHNINLVTPSHFVPQILEALVIAVERGLRLPLVYNTSAYDSLETLALLDGVVDIYLPDMKFWTAEEAVRYAAAPDYPEVARAAIVEMQRQVGPLRLDGHGVAVRGVLVRHLVLPGQLDSTRRIVGWIARELGRDTWLNLMPQYRPAGRVSGGEFAEIDRLLTADEYAAAVESALEAGLHRIDRRSCERGVMTLA